jgi:hypothetical protein
MSQGPRVGSAAPLYRYIPGGFSSVFPRVPACNVVAPCFRGVIRPTEAMSRVIGDRRAQTRTSEIAISFWRTLSPLARATPTAKYVNLLSPRHVTGGVLPSQILEGPVLCGPDKESAAEDTQFQGFRFSTRPCTPQ